MGFFDSILGHHPDPAAGWEAFQSPMPDFDLAGMRFGQLKFGDGFASAAFLGRPNEVRWPQDDYCEMYYTAGGFRIGFEKGKFSYLVFAISPDKFGPIGVTFAFSQPKLLGFGPEAICLRESTRREDLQKLLGPPADVDEDDDETVITYQRNKLHLEFDYTPEGLLKRLDLYPMR